MIKNETNKQNKTWFYSFASLCRGLGPLATSVAFFVVTLQEDCRENHITTLLTTLLVNSGAGNFPGWKNNYAFSVTFLSSLILLGQRDS